VRHGPQTIPIALLAAACVCLTGCAPPRPAIKGTDGPAVAQAPYPALLPFEQLTAPPALPPGLVEGLVAQRAALVAAAAEQRSQP
jgi:hypothetical protein